MPRSTKMMTAFRLPVQLVHWLDKEAERQGITRTRLVTTILQGVWAVSPVRKSGQKFEGGSSVATKELED